MELTIGSNRIHNTTGVITVQGEKQICFHFGNQPERLLLTMQVYSSRGDHIAQLNHNIWTFNTHNRFDLTGSSKHIKLTDKLSEYIVVEAHATDPDRIQVVRGRFFSHKGYLLEITPQMWRIESVSLHDNIIDGCGTSIAIG